MAKQDSANMEPAESHAQSICEVLLILGSKWALLVLEALLPGAQRFNQLQRNVAVVKTQSLTDTLRHLEKYDLVHREVFPTIPVTVEYSLTEKGREFYAALQEMSTWVRKWGGTAQQSNDRVGRMP
ncbi:winged helix-turn-helix transcriptional regulator [Paenibacillus chartarius]|uniref:Winged helix-turn-helix transcriptional regulator n=1 Tax=Paenibacillus chartarius TaxID=747481 RepID=A0ABV6DG74_9BACL